MIIWPQGIYRKILIMTLTLVIGASLLIGLTGLSAMISNTRDNINTYNKELAISEAKVIDALLKGAIDDSKTISQDKDMASSDPTVRQSALAKLFKETNIFNGINVVDNKGTMISFYPDNNKVLGQNISQRDYVQNVLQKGEPYISKPYIALTGNLVVVVASPIKNQNGKTIGLVGGSINLKENKTLSALIRNIQVGEKGYSYIVSNEGKYIYHPNPDLLMQDAFKNNDAAVKSVTGLPGSGTINIKGENYLEGHASVEQTGWGVVVQVPEKEAFYSSNRLKYVLISMLFFIGIFALVLTVRITKKITNPIRLLINASEKVAMGDYNTNVEIESNDEIGRFSRTFNNMVQSIREMRDDILNKKSQLEIINQELQIMANTDGLTKLYNHRYFQETLEIMLQSALNKDEPLSLIIIDIDHFKHYNDVYGHQTGDQLLKDLANILKSQIREDDFIARYGGEEFTIILPKQEIQEARDVAERLRKRVEDFPFYGREQQPDKHVTISIGVASFPRNATNKEELIKLADEALYKAKASTRNRVELYFSVLDELKDELNTSEAELINTIKMLLRIINAKDKYTSGHSERVGLYAIAIGEAMALSKEDLHTIKIGAYLHDIGKIEINRDILTKPDRLTEQEYEIIKMHPIWGADIVKSVEVLKNTVPLILHHHERFDGKGYPQGLTGEETPLLAKIMAVADSFDAMTSNRPYREGMSQEDAKKELLRCSGTQFDAEIVNSFINSLDTKKIELTSIDI